MRVVLEGEGETLTLTLTWGDNGWEGEEVEKQMLQRGQEEEGSLREPSGAAVGMG